MPLNVEPRASGDFIPYFKFNGKSGRWFTKNEAGDEIEVAGWLAIFDLAQIRTGWIHFDEGQPPQTQWDSNGVDLGRPVSMPKAKRGFACNVFAPKLGGLREFSSTSNGAIIAMKDLFNNQYEYAAERAEGKVPVVECKNVLPVKGKFGTNYEPVLKIVKWVDRPMGLPLEEKAAAIPPKPTPASSQKAALDAFGDSDLDDAIPDF